MVINHNHRYKFRYGNDYCKGVDILRVINNNVTKCFSRVEQLKTIKQRIYDVSPYGKAVKVVEIEWQYYYLSTGHNRTSHGIKKTNFMTLPDPDMYFFVFPFITVQKPA